MYYVKTVRKLAEELKALDEMDFGELNCLDGMIPDIYPFDPSVGSPTQHADGGTYGRMPLISV
jgi:hypothetical protein